MAAKTAFEVYLEEHPEVAVNARNPVVYFEPNSDQRGMADFRPQQVSAEAPDPEGFSDFVQGDGWMAAPKGLTVNAQENSLAEPATQS